MGTDKEIRQWQIFYIDAMKKAGLKVGDKVVDFGCGIGNYTLPMSELVEPEGIVYAVDIDKYALKEVKRKANKQNNINYLQPERNGKLDLPSESVDGFMIYDLIHSLRINGLINEVITECDRLLRKDGILSILPFHMSANEIKDLIRYVDSMNFVLHDIQKGAGLHFEMHRFMGGTSGKLSDYERGDIYNFRKR